LFIIVDFVQSLTACCDEHNKRDESPTTRRSDTSPRLLWICCATNPQQIEVMEFALNWPLFLTGVGKSCFSCLATTSDVGHLIQLSLPSLPCIDKSSTGLFGWG